MIPDSNILNNKSDQDDYQKNRNYWKYLKAKLKGENSEVVSGTNQLKLLAPDGKRRLADALDYDGVLILTKSFPNARAMRFVEWPSCIFCGNGDSLILNTVFVLHRKVELLMVIVIIF